MLISEGYIIQNNLSEVKTVNSKDNKSSKEKKQDAAEKFQEGREFVDQIPLEDLKIEVEDERKKLKTKDDSQSERKYKSGDE